MHSLCMYNSVPCQKSKMKLFCKKLLTFFAKGSILDTCQSSRICKGVPAPPPPFLRHPPPNTACPHLFKIFVSPTLFPVPPPFKVF